MTCPTPAINIQNSEVDRETTERILGDTDEENTITVKGTFLRTLNVHPCTSKCFTPKN